MAFIPRPVKIVKKRVFRSPKFYIDQRRVFKNIRDEVVGAQQEWASSEASYYEEVYKYYRASLCSLRTSVPYAEMAKKNSVSSGCVVKEELPFEFLTVKEARQDYTRAYNDMKLERSSFLDLVKSIAARRPRVVFENIDVPVKPKREFPPVRRRWKRRNVEVTRDLLNGGPYNSFYDGCSHHIPELSQREKEEEPQEFEDITVSDHETGETKVVSARVHRIKSWIPPAWSQLQEWNDKVYNEPYRQTKATRFLELRESLSRTQLARDLFVAICSQWLSRLDVQLPEPQMDIEGVVGETPSNVDQKSNVVVQSFDNQDRGVHLPSTNGFYMESVAQESQIYKTLTDRWIYLDSFKWAMNQGYDTSLINIELPKACLLNNKNIQNTQLFYLHRYWRTDMRVKIQINTNPFMVGQLIVSWCYGNDYKSSTYKNVPAMFQRNHCLLNAGSNNDGELVIPYHHFNSVMSARDCSMGYLEVRVVNPLSVPSTTAVTVGGLIFLSFENSQFSGMISRNTKMYNMVNEPQMDTVGALCNLGSNLLRACSNDSNRDNPPVPLQPISLVPQAMPSFAYTDHIGDPINVLRADPRGQLPNVMVLDEMNHLKIAQIWGYLTSIAWNSSSGYDATIAHYPVVPLMLRSRYTGISPIQGHELAFYPPLAVISSMYGKWRGDILFKIQVVASRFHTGRLLLGIVPKGSGGETIEELKCSPYQVFDIADSTEIVFRAPFYWVNAWANSLSSDNAYDEPSRFILKVLNPLIYISSVANYVYLNIFVAAADNFEVALIRHPVLAVDWGSDIILPKDQIATPFNLENKVYITWQRNLAYKSRTDLYAITLYIQDITDGWLGFNYLKKGSYYRLLGTFKDKQVVIKATVGRIVKGKGTREAVEIQYGCYEPDLYTSNAMGMVVFDRLSDAKGYARDRMKLDGPTCREKWCPFWVEDSSWSQWYNKETKKWEVCPNDGDPLKWKYEVDTEECGDFCELSISPEPQMDTRIQGVVTTLDSPVVSTQQGLTTFGEVTPDLKSICRRWNHCCSIVAKTSSTRHPRDSCYLAKFPVVPVRKIHPVLSTEYDNRAREGIMSLVASPYYLWKGGLRYRFVVVGSVPTGATLYVQHRYDESWNSTQSFVTVGSAVKSVRDLLLTQYATFVQALSVNSVSSVEVPYYQSNEQLVLTPCNQDPSSNGMVYVWVHSSQSTEIRIECYYALADDARFSVFQGFPPLMDIGNITVEPQMENPSTSGESRESQGLIDMCKNFVSAPAAVADASVSIDETVKDMKEEVTQTTSRMNKILDTIQGYTESGFMQKMKAKSQESGLTGLLAYLGDKGFSFFSHLIYMILAPSASVIAWGIANLYHCVWGFTLSGVEILVSPLIRLYNKCFGKTQTAPTQPTQGQTPEPQMEKEEDEVASVASVLFTSIASLCKLKAKPPNSWKNIGDGLFDFGSSAKHGSSVGKFVSDNLTLFKRVWNKFLSLFGYHDPNAKLIMGVEDDRIKNWLVEASVITAPSVEDDVFQQPDWSNKIFELSIVGRSILMCLTTSKGIKVSQVIVNVIHKLLDKIFKLEKKLIQRKIFTPARYEPFCLWITGSAGCGKTRFCQEVAYRVSKALNVSHPHPYYPVTPGQKYFNGLNGQPTLLIDDFLAMDPSVDPESYAQFLQMKSSSLFNPPYSEADQKDILVNFPSLIVTSNKSHFSNLPGIHDQAAYDRRRDLLLRFVPRDDKKVNPISAYYSVEDLKELKHVYVEVADDVLNDRTKWVRITDHGREPYSDIVWQFIWSKMQVYHEKEASNYAYQCRKVTEATTILAAAGTSLEDYLTDIKSKLAQCKVDITCFDKWLDKSKQAANHIMPEPSPQLMTNEGYAPEHELADANEAVEGCPYEPLIRSMMSLAPGYDTTECLHRQWVHSPTDKFYVGVNGKPSILASPNPDFSGKRPESLFWDCCLVRTNSGFSQLSKCAMKDEDFKTLFVRRAFKRSFEKYGQTMLDYVTDQDWDDFYRRYPKEFREEILRVHRDERKRQRFDAFVASMPKSRLPSAVDDPVDLVGQTVIPKESRWKSIPRKIYNGLIKLFHVIENVMSYVSRFCISAFSIFTICGFSYLMLRPRPDPQPQLHPSGDFKTIKTAKSTRQKALTLVDGNNGPIEDPKLKQCSMYTSSSSSFEGIKNKLLRNTFFMIGEILSADNKQMTCKARCLGLYNKKFLVIKHYIEHFRSIGVERVQIVYHNAAGIVSFGLDEIKFQWTSQGYGVGEMPTSAPRQFLNITKYIPTEKFDGSYPYECIMMENFWDSSQCYAVDVKPIKSPVVIPSQSTMSSWEIRQGFSYRWGGKGKCGSLLLAPTMATPLIGIHTAGVGVVMGYSELLLRETFIDSEVIPVEYVTPNLDIGPNIYNLEGEYEIVGQLDADMSVVSPTQTKIIPSDISPVFDITTEPAPLTRHDPRLESPECPFYLGVSKRCKKMKEFQIGNVQTSYMDVISMLSLKVKPLRYPGVLSIKEAVEGLVIPGYDAMEMTTSEGYPWVKLRPKSCSDKSWMFKFSEYPDGRRCLEGMIPELYATLEMKDQMRERCIVPASYFTACLKDARISKEKVSIPGKTRIFEISPVDLTIAQRQYFLDFNVAYQTARLEAENSIGINPDGFEWTDLVNKLLANSPYILTADYSGYGPGMSSEILFRAFDAVIAWYENYAGDDDQADKNFKVRYTMKHEIGKALHVARNLVFRPSAGMPSGNCATVIMNSLVNSMYIRIAYLGLASEHAPHFQDMFWFHKFVVLVHNGDDLIMSVKEEILSWFNNCTLIEYFGRYGLKMTDAMKSGVVRPYCDIEEATYLKRGFMRHPFREGLWLAPLNKDSITDTANWIWRCVNTREASLVNSEMCARLAYTHGPDFYDLITTKLRVRWAEEGVLFRTPSWKSLDLHVFEGFEGPLFSFDERTLL